MTTFTAKHNDTTYLPIYICPEWLPKQTPEPWTPYELTQQMIVVGWRPLKESGHYIHCNTFYEIDINKQDKLGDPDWLNWAVARLTPPPF